MALPSKKSVLLGSHHQWDNEVRRVLLESEVPLLIQGESGIGKSRMAREIHRRSRRGHGPFVEVNLASLHEGTFESVLYGHERGAFTGAVSRRQGKFESANGGTLFLDEVGELSPVLQSRLLEFLQEKAFTPLGGLKPRTVDVRVIAATHRDLSEFVSTGRFREDLLWRLGVAHLHLPPLRHESGNLKEQAFGEMVCNARYRQTRELQNDSPQIQIHPTLAEFVRFYPWPGNYRELEAVAEYVEAASGGGTALHLGHLPQKYLNLAKSMGAPNTVQHHESPNPERKYEEERHTIERVLALHEGKVASVAWVLGVNESTIRRKLRAYGLDPQHFRRNHSKPEKMTRF